MTSIARIQKELARHAVRQGDETLYRQEAVDYLINLIPRLVPVDEAFYLTTYEDVKAAVESGSLRNAAQHYAEHGFFEDRLPMPVKVDEDDYLGRYPDVEDGIRQGTITDATQHWLDYGRHEGRTATLQSLNGAGFRPGEERQPEAQRRGRIRG